MTLKAQGRLDRRVLVVDYVGRIDHCWWTAGEKKAQIIGVCSVFSASNGVVLATEKKQKSILYDEQSVHKVEPITKHIGMVYSGMGPDYRWEFTLCPIWTEPWLYFNQCKFTQFPYTKHTTKIIILLKLAGIHQLLFISCVLHGTLYSCFAKVRSTYFALHGIQGKRSRFQSWAPKVRVEW